MQWYQWFGKVNDGHEYFSEKNYGKKQITFTLTDANPFSLQTFRFTRLSKIVYFLVLAIYLFLFFFFFLHFLTKKTYLKSSKAVPFGHRIHFVLSFLFLLKPYDLHNVVWYNIMISIGSPSIHIHLYSSYDSIWIVLSCICWITVNILSNYASIQWICWAILQNSF